MTPILIICGEPIQTIQDGKQTWVGIRRVCDALGLVYKTAVRLLKSKHWASVELKVDISRDGQPRAYSCIDIDALQLWLAMIPPNKIKVESRAKLVVFQREAARVLRDHFAGATSTLAMSDSISAELRAAMARGDEPAARRCAAALAAYLGPPAALPPPPTKQTLKVADAILDHVREENAAGRGVLYPADLVKVLRMRRKDVFDVWAALRAEGRLINKGTRGAPSWWVWDAAVTIPALPEHTTH